jgi:predicted amidophosphoribosyltransferase
MCAGIAWRNDIAPLSQDPENMTSTQPPTKTLFRQMCERCGSKYGRHEDRCPHCKGVSDSESERYRARSVREKETNAHLGVLFLALAGALALLMSVIFW